VEADGGAAGGADGRLCHDSVRTDYPRTDRGGSTSTAHQPGPA
jgi:hypothetical protein